MAEEQNVQAEAVDEQQIQVDGITYNVADLPEGLQNAIGTYGRWQNRRNEAQEELNLVSAACNTLGQQVVTAVRELAAADAAAEAAAAEAAAEAEAATEEAPAEEAAAE